MRLLGILAAVVAAAGTALVVGVHSRPETVVFVVLDTVRADHTSICGHTRDTTPTLTALVEEGASHTCRAYAPGAWTLPSHASFFTGLPAHEHRADDVGRMTESECDALVCAAEGTYFVNFAHDIVRGMPRGVPTLAERFGERGYQTLSVSSNPVVSPVTGLTRGFDSARAPRWFGDMYGDVQVQELERALDQLDPDRPLFVFLNISDAHDPWDPPSGSGEPLAYHVPENDPLKAFLRRELSPREEAELLARVRVYYDGGIRRADGVLRRDLGALRRRGWLRRYRLVVTSDHGELLGEHGLLQHGTHLWEQNQRVPLLYLDTLGRRPLESLTEPVSALQAYHLALEGRTTYVPVVASCQPKKHWSVLSRGRLVSPRAAAEWHGREKTVWANGATTRYDVVSDPLEAHPAPARDRPDLERMARWAEGLAGEVDESIASMLRSLGYAE